jgi:hypothetical protein
MQLALGVFLRLEINRLIPRDRLLSSKIEDSSLNNKKV